MFRKPRLRQLTLDDIESVDVDTVLAVNVDGWWTVVIRREFGEGESCWSYTERTDQLSAMTTMLANDSVVRVYDPTAGPLGLENPADIRLLFAVGDEPEAVGRIFGWTDEVYGRSVGMLVSVNPRQYRGSGCAFTSDASKEALLRALGNDAKAIDTQKMRIYVVPMDWS